MKISLLAATAILIVNSEAKSQICTPDTARYHNSGYYTDHPTNPDKLPDALLNSPYTSYITVNVPVDTTIAGWGTFVIDSVILNRIPEPVKGLFTGLTYAAEPANFRFPGGSKNCIVISGTPTNKSEVGFSTVYLNLTTYFNGIAIPKDVDFQFRLADVVGQNETNSSSLPFRVWPNPASEILYIKTAFRSSATCTIQDITGKQLIEKNTTDGLSEIDISLLQPGLYLLTVQNGLHTATTRFSVNSR